jgi:glycosyltransferase domain-containing protein
VRKLSIIVPLKNRSFYTKIYLENLHDEFFYFFADGSNNDNHKKIFSNIKKINIRYIRYTEDKTVANYIEKINDILKYVETPYVMFSDNDDFILKKGALKCLQQLENKNVKAICAGGKITSIFQCNKLDKKYSMPFTLYDNYSLNKLHDIDGVYEMFKNYRYLYYSIYKTKYIRNFWIDIKNIGLNHITLIEIFLTISSLLEGRYIDTKESHYLRLRNPTSSSDKTENPYGSNHTLKIFFDNTYRKLVFQMIDFLVDKYSINKKEFMENYKLFYIANYNLSYSKKIKKGIMIRFMRYIIKLFFVNKFRIISIKTAKKISSLL